MHVARPVSLPWVTANARIARWEVNHLANKKSAIKRARQAILRTLRNKMWKSSVKTFVRKVRTAVGDGNAAAAAELLPQAFSIIDRAASKGILHKNNAARKKARLARRVGLMTKSA